MRPEFRTGEIFSSAQQSVQNTKYMDDKVTCAVTWLKVIKVFNIVDLILSSETDHLNPAAGQSRESMSEFGGLWKHEKTQHAIYN